MVALGLILIRELLVLGGQAQIPNDSEPAQDPQDVEGDIHFPPKEALVGGALVVMVIVVPAFAEREQGQEEIIAAQVGRLIAAAPPNVAQGVDEEGNVIDSHGAHEKAPKQTAPAANEVAEHGQPHAGPPMVLFEPTQLGILGEIMHVPPVGLLPSFGEDPTNVGMPEAIDDGRMDVFFGVGMEMVMAVMARPPDRPFLQGGTAEQGQDELKRSARFVGAMGKVAMITSGQSPDADGVIHDEQNAGRRRELHLGKKYSQARCVDEDKRDRLHPHGEMIGNVVFVRR